MFISYKYITFVKVFEGQCDNFQKPKERRKSKQSEVTSVKHTTKRS